MKNRRNYLTLALALIMCLCLAACGGGDADSELESAPTMLESEPYDSAAADSYIYDEYLGTWTGSDGAAATELLVESTDSGLYFTFSNGEELVTAGYAQSIPRYDCIYFFNQADGNAYQVTGRMDGMTIESLGTYVLEEKGSRTGGEFADIANSWYLDGDLSAASSITITEEGMWQFFELNGNQYEMVDYGTLEQDPGVEEQYYAHSSKNDGVTYDMHMSFEKEAFSWGANGDNYLRFDLCD